MIVLAKIKEYYLDGINYLRKLQETQDNPEMNPILEWWLNEDVDLKSAKFLANTPPSVDVPVSNDELLIATPYIIHGQRYKESGQSSKVEFFRNSVSEAKTGSYISYTIFGITQLIILLNIVANVPTGFFHFLIFMIIVLPISIANSYIYTPMRLMLNRTRNILWSAIWSSISINILLFLFSTGIYRLFDGDYLLFSNLIVRILALLLAYGICWLLFHTVLTFLLRANRKHLENIRLGIVDLKKPLKFNLD